MKKRLTEQASVGRVCSYRVNDREGEFALCQVLAVAFVRRVLQKHSNTIARDEFGTYFV